MTINECAVILRDMGISLSLDYGCVDLTFELEPVQAREMGFVFPDEYLEGGYKIEGWLELCQNLFAQHCEVSHSNVKNWGWSQQVLILGDFIEMDMCSRKKCLNKLVEKLTKQI